jgi:putative superfamily III holin-X
MDVRRAHRPLSELVADIFKNVQDLLRSEIRLAQSQVRDDLARQRPAALLLAAAAGALLLSAWFALLALLYALRLVMPAWAAALCLAVALALSSAVTLSSGLKRLRAASQGTNRRPHLEERVEWVKEPTR